MNSNLRKFVFHDLHIVEGYIEPPDALVFTSLLTAQSNGGLTGGVAEIGVFYGRSYFLFRKICEESGDNVLGIDLFDVKPAQYERFLENGRRLGLPVDETLIIRGDSTKLQPLEITARVGRTRFFSIDGGHMLHHLAADSVLAAETLAGHGVIAFDDTFNPAWPEVTVGVSDFLRERADEFAAFCMTKYKTYVCRRDFHKFYRNAVRGSPDLGTLHHAETHFLGWKVTHLNNPMSRRIAYEVMLRCGMGALSERAYR